MKMANRFFWSFIQILLSRKIVLALAVFLSACSRVDTSRGSNIIQDQQVWRCLKHKKTYIASRDHFNGCQLAATVQGQPGMMIEF